MQLSRQHREQLKQPFQVVLNRFYPPILPRENVLFDRQRASIPTSSFDWQNILAGDIKGIRVAYSEDWGYMAIEPAVREIVQQAVRVFKQDLGCTVEAANPGWADPYDDFAALIVLDSDLVGMRQMVEKWGDRIEPYVRDFILADWSAEQFTNALRTRKAVCNRMWKLMQRSVKNGQIPDC